MSWAIGEKNMKRAIWSALAAFCVLSAPAMAAPARTRAAPAIVAGMAIVDENGNPVGRVEAIRGTDLLVRTDRHRTLIASSAFRRDGRRLVLNMTRAQVNAAVDRVTPPPPAPPAPPLQIVPGLTVRGIGGVIAGTIELVEPDHVILRLTSGELVRLPRSGVGTNSEGAFISISTAELLRRAEAASPSAGD